MGSVILSASGGVDAVDGVSTTRRAKAARPAPQPLPEGLTGGGAPAFDVEAFDAHKLHRSSRSDGQPRRHVAGPI